MTFNVIPNVAIIKANSPIWERLNPDFTATFNGWPEISIPVVPNNICPQITTKDKRIIGKAY